MNLRTIPHLVQAFNVLAGLSDHTLGITVPETAVALGVCIIFVQENVRSIQPSHGLNTRYNDNVMGRYASQIIKRETPLAWELIDTIQ